ncbi:MAG: MnhB domain-containing protein, partial [Actinomycetota bacterium]
PSAGDSSAAEHGDDHRHVSSRMVILDTASKVLYHSILVLALYFVLAGHNRPGGGFVSGLTVGAAVALRYVTGGAAAVRTTFRIPAHVILGAGLLLAAGTAFVPLLFGEAILEHADATVHLPLFGSVKLNTVILFDVGVDLVVIGLVMMAFAAFGDDNVPPPLGRSRATAAPDVDGYAADNLDADDNNTETAR